MTGKTRYEPESRSAARLGAVQALYQMEAASTPVDAVIEEFVHHRFGTEVEGVNLPLGDEAFFADLLRGIVDHQDQIDPAVKDILAEGWKLTRLDATMRALLRAGAAEFIVHQHLSHAVIMDEYVSLAHDFFEESEAKFANAVLDNVGNDLRA